jgi:hypothetical protein
MKIQSVVPIFGATVTVISMLKRRCKGYEKYWEPTPITPRKGILIGYRNLSNGVRDWESEVGYIYTPKKYLRAAVVVFSDRENPVYVPVSAMEAGDES